MFRLISAVRLTTACRLPSASASSSIGSSLKLAAVCRSGVHMSAVDMYAAPLQLKMPALSPTMSEGQIVKWYKKEGDAIAPGDVLFEVQTDKAVMAFEMDEEGTLAKILVLLLFTNTHCRSFHLYMHPKSSIGVH